MERLAFILLSLAILLLMVLIHEAGHYTTAKILGFTVDEFAIGFGPKLFKKRRKNGELFSVRALPLGGFCAFYGEADDGEREKTDDTDKEKKSKAKSNADTTADAATDGEKEKPVMSDETVDGANVTNGGNIAEPVASENDDLLSFVMKAKVEEDAAKAEAEKIAKEPPAPPRLDKNGNPAVPFNAQKPWKRIIVLLGGVLFNFLSAIIFSLIYIWVVGFPVPQVGEVYTYEDPVTHIEVKYNDFEKGDKIIAVDGKNITVMRSYDDIMKDVGNKNSVKFKVLRGGKEVEIIAERKQITPPADGGEPYFGFGFVSQSAFIGNNAGNAFKYCVPYTGKLSWSILGAFGDILTGKQSITTMSGPVGSISMMADVSAADWRNVLILLPLLASNLAIFNLLPFPALDGAHVVFTVIEWIRRKPINRKVEGIIHLVGMVVLLLFVCVVDIISFAT